MLTFHYCDGGGQRVLHVGLGQMLVRGGWPVRLRISRLTSWCR
jgi:hypothetical protein